MQKDESRVKEEFSPSTKRIEAFSDGVFAIVVTLLVLELRVPELAKEFSNSDALNALYTGISFNMVLRHSVRSKLFKENISNETLQRNIKRGSLGPVIYFISVIAAPVSVYISLAIFILVPVI